MIVISDTSPLINLAAIQQETLLTELFGRVTIPEAVREEASTLAASRPEFPRVHESKWIDVQTVRASHLVRTLHAELHVGEAEAIALSVELDASLLLMDERIGRRKAAHLSIKTLGLLGVLIEAKRQGYIGRVKNLIDELEAKAGFWIGKELYRRVLAEVGEG